MDAKAEMSELYRLATLGRMLAGVVHEISTPAGSLASNNEVLLRSLESLASDKLPERAARTVASLRELAEVDRVACERIGSLVLSVKRMARTNQGEPAPADINRLLGDALRLVAHQYKRRIAVETDFAALPDVMCREQLLGQVFLNVLVNAGHAIEGEGRVAVSTRMEDGMVHVAISDSGRGIDPSVGERIFESGFTTKPPGQGTGLGLAISRQIVQAHGGSIDFESRAGQGTTFHIRIPVQRGG